MCGRLQAAALQRMGTYAKRLLLAFKEAIGSAVVGRIIYIRLWSQHAVAVHVGKCEGVGAYPEVDGRRRGGYVGEDR
jgi:hypothetical protein